MKLLAKSILAALSLAIPLFAAAAPSQTRTVRCEIPFQFIAGNQVLPAGEYRLTVDPDHMLFLIHSVANAESWMIRYSPGGLGRDADKTGNGMLRFAKYGTQYFLTGVWEPGRVDGNRVLPSRRLVESAKLASGAEIAAVHLEVK